MSAESKTPRLDLIRRFLDGEIGSDKLALKETYVDDHILCAVITILDTDIDAGYVGWEGCAAFKYAPVSPEALEEARTILRGLLDDDEAIDAEDHELSLRWGAK